MTNKYFVVACFSFTVAVGAVVFKLAPLLTNTPELAQPYEAPAQAIAPAIDECIDALLDIQGAAYQVRLCKAQADAYQGAMPAISKPTNWL